MKTHKDCEKRVFSFGDMVTNDQGEKGKVIGINLEKSTLLVNWLKHDTLEVLSFSMVSHN